MSENNTCLLERDANEIQRFIQAALKERVGIFGDNLNLIKNSIMDIFAWEGITLNGPVTLRSMSPSDDVFIIRLPLPYQNTYWRGDSPDTLYFRYNN